MEEKENKYKLFHDFQEMDVGEDSVDSGEDSVDSPGGIISTNKFDIVLRKCVLLVYYYLL